MASVIAEVDQFDATVTVPDDGDTRSAASVTAAGVGFQAVTNRARYLYNRNIGASGGNYNLAMLTALQDAGNRFTHQWGSGFFRWLQTSVATTGNLVFDIPSVHGAYLDGVTLTVHGDVTGAGPHVGLPGTMPAVSVYKIVQSSGVSSLVAAAADTSANVAAYEVIHTIALSFATQTMDEDNSYFCLINGETGANSIANAFCVLGAYSVISAA